MPQPDPEFLTRLREALSASWGSDTSYRAIVEPGNPALGQCYPTSRVVQYFIPDAVVFEGTVWTGAREEKHFWNGLQRGNDWEHIDLSWQQFPPGSMVRNYAVSERPEQSDGPEAVRRCTLLLSRVKALMSSPLAPPQASLGRGVNYLCMFQRDGIAFYI